MNAHFIRTTGERYDGDWFSGPSCDCGCDYHGHECAYDTAPSTAWQAKTRDQKDAALADVHARIAKAFKLSGWERAEASAIGRAA